MVHRHARAVLLITDAGVAQATQYVITHAMMLCRDNREQVNSFKSAVSWTPTTASTTKPRTGDQPPFSAVSGDCLFHQRTLPIKRRRQITWSHTKRRMYSAPRWLRPNPCGISLSKHYLYSCKGNGAKLLSTTSLRTSICPTGAAPMIDIRRGACSSQIGDWHTLNESQRLGAATEPDLQFVLCTEADCY